MSLAFAADWLSLREPADHRARSRRVTEAAVASLAGRRAPLVVDLGCGRGSNLRYLAPHLPAGTRWRLVDRDRALLTEAAAGQVSVETVVADLRTADLAGLVAEADLVTAAALLDLVDGAWLEALLDAGPRALLVTGNVDGRIEWQPGHPLDPAMTAAFLEHHGGDKGFGAALGVRAPAVLEASVRARGWAVSSEAADWRLGPSAAALQAAYLAGAVAAIGETGLPASDLRRWAEARQGWIERGESRLLVGHVDLYAQAPASAG
ncbi:MAG: class I SAM-dependent methyltransferase [Geminicoccaceae bacterium]|nr:MAG: class I SAM-dependent methyltransferase [Geminicoccaceae bacterium]